MDVVVVAVDVAVAGVEVAAVAAEAAVAAVAAAAGAAAVSEAAAYRGASAVFVESMQFLAHWQKKEGRWRVDKLPGELFAPLSLCDLSAPRTTLNKRTLLRIIAQ